MKRETVILNSMSTHQKILLPNLAENKQKLLMNKTMQTGSSEHRYVKTLVTLLVVFFLAAIPARAAERQQLHNHVPAAVQLMQLQPIGSLPGTTNLDLVIGLPLRNQDALTKLLQQLYDPASTNFNHYLTPEQFTEMFGPNEKDFQTLINFVRSNKLAIVNAPQNHMLLHIRAPVADIERVFHVKMRLYQHPAEDRAFYAPDVEPSLDLNVPVLYITGLNNFTIPHVNRKLRTVPLNNQARPKLVPRPALGGFSGNDFRAAYAPGVSLNGAGQVIGVLQLGGGYFPSDIKAYETQCGLPNVPLQNVYLDGYAGHPHTDMGLLDTVESPLDIEMAIAMAPGLSKVVIYGADGDSSCVDLLNEMANPTKGEPRPNQLSSSYAIFYDDNVYKAFKQLAAQRQSFFAYSGDDGAYNPAGSGCFPPADYPYVTCVGGTMLTTSSPGGSWVSETTWPYSGGGISYDDPINFAIPYWQLGLDMSANGGSTTMRNCPDVAIVADNIYVICGNGQSNIISGTSAATPLWAGFTALVNQRAVASGRPPVGFINPAIYAIGRGSKYSICFHDITTGNNTWSASPNLFYATNGYDLCTGWGTPNGLYLINMLALGNQPLNAYLQYMGSRCDPGPVAGGTATFAVYVNGLAPFTYQWSQYNAPITSGGNATSSESSIKVPAFGSSGTLSVIVTDAVGSTVTNSVTVTGLDPKVARAEERLCELLSELNQFKRPLYINPGDPSPIEFQFNPYTESELKMIQETVDQLSTTIKSFQSLGMPYGGEKQHGKQPDKH